MLSSSRIPYFAACKGVRWDPVTGCSNNSTICAVLTKGACWAKSMAWKASLCSRCGAPNCEKVCPPEVVAGPFAPRFHPEELDAPLRTRKPRVIAVGFGGDLWSDGVDPGWRRQVFAVEQQCPQHVFVHLTKNPERIFRDNVDSLGLWFGATITDDDHTIEPLAFAGTRIGNHRWFSFEPVLGTIDMRYAFDQWPSAEFAVIGGFSNGSGRVLRPDEGGTRPEWVAPIIEAACEAGCKVFLKNLRKEVITQITNPRTGRKFESMYELREIPDEWLAVGK